MQRQLPFWRSMMYVPGNVERFIEKAHTRGADALIIDLEDSVLPADKPATRAAVQQVAERIGRTGLDIAVRINRPWRLAVPDLEAVISPRIRALALPKVADASHVRAIAEICDELEAERGMVNGHTVFVAMVETADAFFELREIAKASRRVVGLTLGSEDFALSLGMLAEPEGLHTFTLPTVAAARAAGILPMGFVGSIAQFGDREAFRGMIRQARRLGFEGAMCIHPDQVAILNQEFAPSEAEVRHAEKVIVADREARAQGRGSFTVDGKMGDIPIVVRAEQTLAKRDRIAKLQAKAGG
ncbi:MAG: CoA ester lyase [Alphaproteobacteria bacterium]|nr:CoA ester lyase [Alphaproteobacteria bacterium]